MTTKTSTSIADRAAPDTPAASIADHAAPDTRAAASIADHATPGTRAAEVALGVVLLLLGIGAATVALLGPLGAGVIVYHVSEGAAQQVRGGDLAGLLLMAPWAWVSAALLLRGHRAGASLALAPAAYGLYMYSQLAISGDIDRYVGTSHRYFPLFWALTTLSGVGVILAGVRIVRDPMFPRYRRRLVRGAGWYSLVVAAFLLVGLHLPGLLDAWRQEPVSAEYLADPNVFWVVKLMDLAFVLPLLVGLGVGLLRDRTWARELLAPMTGCCALMASSVAGMAVSMLLFEAPGSSLGLASGFSLAAIGALMLALAAYRPLFDDLDHAPPGGDAPLQQ